MKREIKFRAWNGKYMLDASYGNWVSFDGVPYTEADRYNTPNIEVQKAKGYILMQYTGLKDKNGKEIFQSDILKDSGGHHWVVEWNEDHAFFGLRSIKIENSVDPIDNQNMWIVGNIYENPELLNS